MLGTTRCLVLRCLIPEQLFFVVPSYHYIVPLYNILPLSLDRHRRGGVLLPLFSSIYSRAKVPVTRRMPVSTTYMD